MKLWKDSRGEAVHGDWPFEPVTKTVTFDGATDHDPGDIDGDNNPLDLFIVSGVIECRLFGYCSTDLAGATATLIVGIAGDTDLLIPSTTATDLDAGMIWMDATPAINKVAADLDVHTIGSDIIQTAGTADITAGVVTYTLQWRPLSPDATVAAAPAPVIPEPE